MWCWPARCTEQCLLCETALTQLTFGTAHSAHPSSAGGSPIAAWGWAGSAGSTTVENVGTCVLCANLMQAGAGSLRGAANAAAVQQRVARCKHVKAASAAQCHKQALLAPMLGAVSNRSSLASRQGRTWHSVLPSQRAKPAAQVHCPLEQAPDSSACPAQALPQLPQWLASPCRSTQALPQISNPACGQGGWGSRRLVLEATSDAWPLFMAKSACGSAGCTVASGAPSTQACKLVAGWTLGHFEGTCAQPTCLTSEATNTGCASCGCITWGRAALAATTTVSGVGEGVDLAAVVVLAVTVGPSWKKFRHSWKRSIRMPGGCAPLEELQSPQVKVLATKQARTIRTSTFAGNTFRAGTTFVAAGLA